MQGIQIQLASEYLELYCVARCPLGAYLRFLYLYTFTYLQRLSLLSKVL